MKNLHTFEEFLNESVKQDQQKAIDILTKELKWNNAQVHIPTTDEISMYSTSSNKLTIDNGLIYWGMAGQSLIKDIKDTLSKVGITASVFRGFETSRRSDEHDYVIVLK